MRVLGKEHPRTLNSMRNLALTLKNRGCDNEAVSLMETYLRIGKQVFGSRHPKILSGLDIFNKW
jgi:hypothetical protein